MGLKVAGRLLLAVLLGATAWLAATAAPRAGAGAGSRNDELAGRAQPGHRPRRALRRCRRGAFSRRLRREPARRAHRSARRQTRGALSRHPPVELAIASAGESGPFLLNALAFVLAAAAASWALRVALGAAAPVWIALFLFGSVAFTSVFRWQSEILVFAAVVLAGALVWGRESPTIVERGPDQIYGGDLETPRRALALADRRPVDRRRGGAPSGLRLDRSADAARPAAFAKALAAAGSGGGALRSDARCARSLSSWRRRAHPGRRRRRSSIRRCWAGMRSTSRSAAHAGLLVGFLPIVALLLSPRKSGRPALPAARRRSGGDRPAADGAVRLGRRPLGGRQSLVPAALRCPPLLRRARPCACAARSSSRSRSVPFMAPFWIAPLSDGTRRTGGTRGVHLAAPGAAAVRNLAPRASPGAPSSRGPESGCAAPGPRSGLPAAGWRSTARGRRRARRERSRPLFGAPRLQRQRARDARGRGRHDRQHDLPAERRGRLRDRARDVPHAAIRSGGAALRCRSMFSGWSSPGRVGWASRARRRRRTR